jgi:receptor protein-tyrosine kinase
VVPVSPNLGLNLLLALLFSALVAGGAAIVSDLTDNTVRDPEQVARTLRADVIASLPLLKGRRRQRYLRDRIVPGAVTPEEKGFEESVRSLRNSILLENFEGAAPDVLRGGGERRYRSLLVTSAAPGEGKTTTAVHLAAAHARQGHRTLLIDGDLRRPSVHKNFHLAGVAGLADVLCGEAPWRDALVPVDGIAALQILPAGPSSLRGWDRVEPGLAELLAQAAAEFDLVVLDAPPLLGFAEPLTMAAAVDGVLVVARAGHTPRRALAGVLAALHRMRAKLAGIVLNEVHRGLSDSYGYYGYDRSYDRRFVEESLQHPSRPEPAEAGS